MPSLEMPSGEMNEISAPTIECGNGEKSAYGPMPLVTKLSSGKAEANGQVEMAGEWTKWQDLKGCCISSPAAASWGQNRLDIFAIGTNSQLYHKQWDGEWSKWSSLGGACIYKPAAVCWGENRLDVFAIGIDKKVYRKWWDGSTWNGWENLGGTCIHGIAAASWGPRRIDLFTVGTNSVVYHNSFADNEWQGWQPLKLKNQDDWEKSSTSIGAPAAVASKQGRIDVFTLGVDNHVYHAWGDGESWEGWKDLGGQAIQGVAAASRGECLDLFTVSTDDDGTDNHLYHRTMKAGTWSDWENLGGVCVSAPAAVAVGDDRVDTFVVGTRSGLWQKTWSPNAEISGGVSVATEDNLVFFGPADLFATEGRGDIWVFRSGWRRPESLPLEIDLNALGITHWMFTGSRRDVIAAIATFDQIYFGRRPDGGLPDKTGFIGVRTFTPPSKPIKTPAEVALGKIAGAFATPFFEAAKLGENLSSMYDRATAIEPFFTRLGRQSTTPNVTIFYIANPRDVDADDYFSRTQIFWKHETRIAGFQAASAIAEYWETQDNLVEALFKGKLSESLAQVKDFVFKGPGSSYQAVAHALLGRGERI